MLSSEAWQIRWTSSDFYLEKICTGEMDFFAAYFEHTGEREGSPAKSTTVIGVKEAEPMKQFLVLLSNTLKK